jgi:hypothetical protein
MWTMVDSEDTRRRALKQARGCYQRALIHGTEAISGGTLRGKALSYKRHYMVHAANLLARIRAAGIAVDEVKGPRGKRILYLHTSA